MHPEKTAEELGLNPRPADPQVKARYTWDYWTLRDPPPLNPDAKRLTSSMYRGIVPAKNIQRRDFAVNGAIVCPSFQSLLPQADTDVPISSIVFDALRVHARSRLALDLVLLPRGRHASPRDPKGGLGRDGAPGGVAAASVPAGRPGGQRQPYE